MCDVIRLTEKEIDAIISKYSDSSDIDVALQNMSERIELLESALTRSTNELHDWFMKGGGKSSPFIVASNLKLLGVDP